MLRSAKDKRDLFTTAGVYLIPCSCGQVYIETTKRSIHTRIKEHERHCGLKQLGKKMAVAEHALKQAGHEILFQNTELLDNISNHVRLHREATEIHKHQHSFNKKRRKPKTEQSLKNTSCKKVKKLYPATRTSDHCTQKTSKQHLSITVTDHLPPYHNNTSITKNTLIAQSPEKDKKLIPQLQRLNYPTHYTRTRTEF